MYPRHLMKKNPSRYNLMQLYLYDFSEIDGMRVDKNGILDYQYLDLYWRDPEVCIRINEISGEGDQSGV